MTRTTTATAFHCVYEIADPETGVFYVGASWTFQDRKKRHLKLRSVSTRDRIQAIRARGAEPLFSIVARCADETDRRRLELYTVAFHLASGRTLCNPKQDITLARRMFPGIFDPEPKRRAKAAPSGRTSPVAASASASPQPSASPPP